MVATFDMKEDNSKVTVFFHNVDKDEISKRFPEAEWDRMRKHSCFSTRATMGNIEMVFFSKEEV
jgi:hypothetical protein